MEMVGYVKNGIPHGVLKNVSEIDYSQFIHIFPNPTNNVLTIKTEKLSGKIIFEIIDFQGRVVQSGNFEQQITADVSGFSNGIYFVILKNQEGAIIHREKVIVQ